MRDVKEMEKFLKSMGCDPNQKLDMPNGGIRLKNILLRYDTMRTHELIERAVSEIRELKNKP